MTNPKERYDLICSLGGNCSAAHNLKFRNMRYYSLPFDRCYVTDEAPFRYLSKGFQNNFSDFFLKENLIQQEGNIHHPIIYRDSVSLYFFPHHLKATLDTPGSYESAASKMQRRIGRLLKKMKEAQSILFILATAFCFDIECIRELSATLNKLYPDKNIQFKVLQFDSPLPNSEEHLENIHLMRFSRLQNNYDFYKTNFEWAFLDSIEISSAGKKKNKWTLLSVKAFDHVMKLEFSFRPTNGS